MLGNYVLETTNAPGTATTVNLAGAPAGRKTFASTFATGALAFYFLDDGTQAEWGIALFTAGNPNTLSRNTVINNTAGTTVRLNFTGTTNAYNEIPGGSLIYTDANGRTGVGYLPNGASFRFDVLGAGRFQNQASGTALTVQTTASGNVASGQIYHAGVVYGAYTRVNQTNGNFEFVNTGYTAVTFSVTQGGTYFGSDERLKENIAPTAGCLDTLRKLRVVDFSMKDDRKPAADQVGLLGHEVEAILPSLVSETHVDGGLPDQKMVMYSGLVPRLLRAVQELADQVDVLKAARLSDSP